MKPPSSNSTHPGVGWTGLSKTIGRKFSEKKFTSDHDFLFLFYASTIMGKIKQIFKSSVQNIPGGRRSALFCLFLIRFNTPYIRVLTVKPSEAYPSKLH